MNENEIHRKKLRIVFFGTAEFAVPSLEALVAAGHEILVVVTQPDKPQGRGRQLFPSPVKMAALKYGLQTMQPKRVRSENFLSKMRELKPDALALAAFGQIIPQALLDIPPLGPINVHGSLLPKHRGAAPIQRAIMAGEKFTGVTTMRMDATLDTGDILLSASIPIEVNDTSGTLIEKLSSLGASLLVETLEGLSKGTLSRTPQDHGEATLAPALTPEDTLIRWEESAERICNRVRGLVPRLSGVTEIGGKRLKVWAAEAVQISEKTVRPGVVIAIQKRPAGVLVASGQGGVVLLTEVQPENGKRMSAADWARGVRLATGSGFETIKGLDSPETSG